MYTQCPHCQTLFRISADQLKAAAGKAHCCRCDRVFSALDNLREPDREEAWPESRFIDDLPEQQNLELPFETTDSETVHQDLHSGLTDLLKALQIKATTPEETEATEDENEQIAVDDDRDPFEPAYELNDSEMDSVQIGLDSLFCGPLLAETEENSRTDEDSAIDADTEPNEELTAETEETAGEALPFTIPDNLPELKPTEQEALSLADALTTASSHKKGTLGWSLLILLLLIVAGGQLSWFGRDHLLQYPPARQLLEQGCALINCQLPPRIDPSKIEVVSRSISSHPDYEGILLVMLTLRNQANFEQPYPILELSFLDSTGALVARRSFTPEVYRGTNAGLIQPGIPESLRLELQDPGEEVVGFQFDFY
ncbi:MAG: DUF3426 domain-containing protein [Sedimenticola sp.]|nr:DUF3426 domain-containing protein [Sedimenticola sp.]